MSDEERQPVEYGLVMPFVVTKDNGGPYDAPSFVAGWECGAVEVVLSTAKIVGARFGRWARPDVIPQLDLIAMKHGYTLTKGDPYEVDGRTEYIEVQFAPSGIDPEETR